MASLSSMPFEIMNLICNNLDYADLCSCRAVCHRLHEYVELDFAALAKHCVTTTPSLHEDFRNDVVDSWIESSIQKRVSLIAEICREAKAAATHPQGRSRNAPVEASEFKAHVQARYSWQKHWKLLSRLHCIRTVCEGSRHVTHCDEHGMHGDLEEATETLSYMLNFPEADQDEDEIPRKMKKLLKRFARMKPATDECGDS